MAKKAPKEYRKTKLIVSGKGHFPTDMLRYDSCVVQEERHTILVEGFSTLPREITLWRFSQDGTKATAERWKSFGWTVIYDEGV